MGMGISIAIATNDRNESALRPPLRPGLLGARSVGYETLAEGVLIDPVVFPWYKFLRQPQP